MCGTKDRCVGAYGGCMCGTKDGSVGAYGGHRTGACVCMCGTNDRCIWWVHVWDKGQVRGCI